MNITPEKLKQAGFSHIFIPLVIVVLMAIFGTYLVINSHADTLNYPIVNANSLCLNNRQNLAVPKNPVELYRCTGKEAEQWTVKDNAIVNSNGYCLASKGVVDEKFVVIQSCDNSPLQTWIVNPQAKTIVSKPTGLCLDVEDGSSANNALVQVNTCNNSPTQQWVVQRTSDVPPVINSFTVSAPSVVSGKTATLNWSTTGDGTCSVLPAGPTATTATSWTTTALTTSTTYTLNCSQNNGPVTSKTVAVAVTVPAPAPAPKPAPATTEKFGMSAPSDLWAQRLADVGGAKHIKYRRVYMTSFTAGTSLIKQSIADGMTPIISYKTGNWSWSQVASGAADADLQTMVKNLNAIPGPKFVAIHHEPAKDGTAADWSNMQLHALPIIKKSASQVSVGVIGNGWWWSSKANGYSDAEIAQWLPAKLIAICDVIGADTYEDVNQNEDGSVKITNMVAWSKRVGGVKGIGIGEWNGLSAASVTRTMNVIKKEPSVKWALEWNSADSGVGLYLSGTRLTAFKAGLATTNQL